MFNKSDEEDFLIRAESSASERSVLQWMRIRNFRAVLETASKLSIEEIGRRRLRPD
jgi:hypothetical protein